MIFREKKLLGALLLFLFCPFFSLAQNNRPLPPPYLAKKNDPGDARPLRGGVKVSLLDMVDLFGPLFALGIEQKVSDRVTAHLEGGYLTSFGGRYILQRDLEGYKMRAEVRVYDKDGFCDEGVSFGFQLMHKFDRAFENGDFMRANGNFFQNIDFHIERRVIAGHISVNVIFPLETNTFLEVSAWAGVRHLARTYLDVPEDATLVSDFGVFISREPGNFVLPSAGMAFRIGLGW